MIGQDKSREAQPLVGLVGTAARPHPARSRLGLYPLHGSVQSRYADMDVNGHMNNLALESLHENARATMNEQTFPDVYKSAARQLRLVTSQNVVHFLAEAHWPATVQTGVGIGRIGRTSFVASSALFIDGVCVSVCDAVLVALNDDGPVELSEDARKAMSALLLGPT